MVPKLEPLSRGYTCARKSRFRPQPRGKAAVSTLLEGPSQSGGIPRSRTDEKVSERAELVNSKLDTIKKVVTRERMSFPTELVIEILIVVSLFAVVIWFVERREK